MPVSHHTSRRLTAWVSRLAWSSRLLQGAPHLAMACALGALGALVALGFAAMLVLTERWLSGYGFDFSGGIARLPWWQQVALPAAGGLIAGLFLHWAIKLKASRTAPTEYLEAIYARSSTLDARDAGLKAISSFFSIVSGGSIGKEGAMVQLAATASSLVSPALKLRGDTFRLGLCMAATGGLTAVYHTPIGAALFVAEIALGGFELRRISLLFISAATASLIVVAMAGFAPLYPLAPDVVVLHPVLFAQVIVVGLCAGLAGAVLLWAVRYASSGFRRVAPNVVLRMTLGGMAVGGFILISPEVAGNGYGPIFALLSENILPISVGLLLLLKIGATAVTVGSGAVGGLFTPALMVGALTAACVAPTLLTWSDTGTTVTLIAAGMAAALAATTQAPLMATVVLIEMTQEAKLALPLMLACAVAYSLSRVMGQAGTYGVLSRYRELFDRRSALPETRVQTVMAKPTGYARLGTPFGEVNAQARMQRNRFVLLLDDAGRFHGAVSVHDVMAQPAHDLIDEAAVRSLLVPDFPIVTQNQNVIDVWDLIVASPADRVPVVNDMQQRIVVGTLQRQALLARMKLLLG